MKALLLSSICFATVLAVDLNLTWHQYKNLHGKVYDDAEDQFRSGVFRKNMKLAALHNHEADRGFHSYRMGPTKFADLTNEEYRELLQRRQVSSSNANYEVSGAEVPDSVDWRTSGFVPPVRDQGQCGDPLLFATMDSLEFQERLFYKSLFALSMQELLECCNATTGSCNGAFLADYVKCLKDLGGIESESSYPPRDLGPCMFDPEKVVLTVKGEVVFPTGDEIAMKEGVANLGLAVAGIDASNFSFQLYSGGIYDEPDCNSGLLDHALVVVGYGSDGDRDFWIAKNSWGTNWGEAGYIRLSRNKENQCGIATSTYIPITGKP